MSGDCQKDDLSPGGGAGTSPSVYGMAESDGRCPWQNAAGFRCMKQEGHSGVHDEYGRMLLRSAEEDA